MWLIYRSSACAGGSNAKNEPALGYVPMGNCSLFSQRYRDQGTGFWHSYVEALESNLVSMHYTVESRRRAI